jgi:hypothetical protein
MQQVDVSPLGKAPSPEMEQYRSSELSELLNKFLRKYAGLSRIGQIHCVLLCDQDAKLIAVNTHYYKVNLWDICAITAALYGVAKQGKDYLSQHEEVDRCSLFFQNSFLFCKKLADIPLENTTRELLMCVIGKDLNMGLIYLLMNDFALKFPPLIENNDHLKTIMLQNEQEYTQLLKSVKAELLAELQSLGDTS